MDLSTIIWILALLLLVGAIAYFYYHYMNKPTASRSSIRASRRRKSKTRPEKIKDSVSQPAVDLSDDIEKKVRFNSDVTYKTFPKAKTDTPKGHIDTPSYRPRRTKTELSISPSPHDSGEEIHLTESPSASSVSVSSAGPVFASNVEHSDKAWDSGFGLPLMNPKAKSKFVKQMRGNHNKYQQSLGDIAEYQTDRSTIIQTDTTIDPFKGDGYDGLTIKDIYDRQTAGPKAKPKAVSCRTDNLTIYTSESEMNGGKLRRSNLNGFDGSMGEYSSWPNSRQ